MLISSSKDGFLKFWDLEQQSCLSSFSDELMTKIADFVLVPELKVIVVGCGSDATHLKLYQVFINEKTYLLDIKIQQKIKKESTGRVIEMRYDTSKRLLSCLNSDNKLEFFKVTIDNEESILKKMVRIEKRRSLKRTKNEAEENQEANDDLPLERKVDKAAIRNQIQ